MRRKAWGRRGGGTGAHVPELVWNLRTRGALGPARPGKVGNGRRPPGRVVANPEEGAPGAEGRVLPGSLPSQGPGPQGTRSSLLQGAWAEAPS